MRYTKYALALAIAAGLSAAAASAQTVLTQDVAATAYEYGNYDYYNAAAGPAQAPSSVMAEPRSLVPPPPPQDAAPACSATENNSADNHTTSNNANNNNTSNSSSSGCSSCNSSGGCDSCHHHSCWLFDGDDCLDCCKEEPNRYLGDCCCLQQRDINIYGWVDGGIMGNAQSPGNHYNGPVTFPDRDDGQLNQLYGVIERTAASDNCGWFVGGRVDFLYGSDYVYTTAAGLDGTTAGNIPRWGNSSFQYGAALPQAYAEVDYNDLKIKLGHFYTIIGYESVPSVQNFFYTHSYTEQYGEPFTHTGVLASKPLDDNWTLYAGIDNGWNNFDSDSRANFIGGITFSDDDWGSLAFAIQTGGESNLNEPGVAPFSNRTMYSIVWTRSLSSRWTYVLQHDLGVQSNSDEFNANASKQADWYGINQYLFYRINNRWTFGWRAEWFDDPEGYVVTGLRPGNPDQAYRFPGSFYETSLGLNYKPNANITIRPEVRYDWYTGPGGFVSPAVPGLTPNQPFNDNFNKNQFLFGLDGIIQF